MHSVIFIAAARNTRHKLSSFSAAVIFVLRWAQCWRSGRSLALWRSADDGAGLVPASGGLLTPTRTANGCRSARPSARLALPCGLRRMAVLLPRIDRLVFVLQVNTLGDPQSLPLNGAQTGCAAATHSAKVGAVRCFDVGCLAACTHCSGRLCVGDSVPVARVGGGGQEPAAARLLCVILSAPSAPCGGAL